jgi:NADH:ubiquinone oxidoreductase subunit F (NADH-binding)
MSLPFLAAADGWPVVLLERAASVDPTAGIDAAEAAGAWRAFRHAVTELGPDAVISIVSESGLRGRGGGGFLAGRKWRHCADQPGGGHHVVANGFEADPGARLDRTLMELDPHAVVEGTAIAAWAVGAVEATIAVRASAATAAAGLRRAIAEAEVRGYLGARVLDSGRSLHIGVRELTGGFVLGEETVLLRAIEQRRAQPEQRPPYPSQHGLWGRPTVVNNVKTLATVPWIVRHGAAAHAALGSPEMPGTTLVQLGGAVARPGIVEAPLGATVGELLASAAPTGTGRGSATSALKAVLVGGPTGGFLPPSALDTPFTGEALAAAGAEVGSGMLLAVDASSCLVELATLMTRYLSDEACGKTIPCRIGTRRLSELGGAACSGHARPTDAAVLADLARDMRDAALCGLEAAAGNPLLTGMRYFADEFEDHLVRGRCPAGTCRALSFAGDAHARRLAGGAPDRSAVAP